MSDDQLPIKNSSLVSVVRDDDAGGYSDEKPAVNPVLRIHALLHGRYRYAITLGCLFAFAGALAAYLLTPPKYEIVGYVRVKPYIPKILYQTDQNGVLPSFETYVNFQESLIQSQRVMDRASQNPEWAALHHKPTADGTNPISTDNLVVDHEKGTELITVTATDRDLNVAMAAVKSIIKAYTEISVETESEGGTQRLQTLEDLRTGLSNQQRDIRDQILSIASEDGTDDLSKLRDLKTEDANRIGSELQEIELAIAQALPEQQPTAASSTSRPTQLTREEVAVSDQRMQKWLLQEDQLKLKLVQLKSKLGEKSQQVLETVSEINYLEQQINDLLDLYQTGGLAVSPGSHDRSKMSMADLRLQHTNVKALYDKVHLEAQELGRKDLHIRDLKDQEDRITKRLNEASAQIDQLTLEGGPLASRISVLSDGEKPTTPPKSKRLPMTAAGAFGGMGLGVGIIALWGLADRRLRSALQVQQLQPAIRMLGVLPILPEGLSKPEDQLMAAHCVHQIRTRLDTSNHTRGHVLAITSPSAGDGKTSLSLALGLSFAGAGYRTLLIDCDVVGGGLTSRLNAVAHRGIGSALHAEGLLTLAQLKEAHKICLSTHRKLTQVLLELGYVTQADIDRLSTGADQTPVGLISALEGDPVSACVTPVLAKGLFVLPLGEASAEHTSKISPKAFRRIVSDSRALFDIVIVDTGPILGSLEASIVAREVDEVVLAVANNGSTPLVKRALALLESLGASLSGLVFNRASQTDVFFASYGSSSSNLTSRPARNQNHRPGDTSKLPRLGALATAVVNTAVPTSTNGASNGRTNGSPNGVNGAATEGNGHDTDH
jgi:succinoglycan biosynthesis transport protein ExoP